MFGANRTRKFSIGGDVIQVSAPRNPVVEGAGVSPDALALFGVVWPAAETLAHWLLAEDVASLRVLEIGCGLGLVSLALNARGAQVTALDIHPAAGKLLNANVIRNRQAPVQFHRASWADAALGEFDLVVASDVLYEPKHLTHLAQCVRRHSRPGTRVVIAEPNRGQHQGFINTMQRLGFRQDPTADLDDAAVQIFSFEYIPGNSQD